MQGRIFFRWIGVVFVLGWVGGLVSVPGAGAVGAPEAGAQNQALRLQSGPGGPKVEPELAAAFDAQGQAGYLIYFAARPDLAPAQGMDWTARGRFVQQALQQAAEQAQAPVRRYLDSRGVAYRSFWIDNVIAVPGSSRAVFDGLQAYPQVASLRARRVLSVVEPEDVQASPLLPRLGAGIAPQAATANLLRVQADQVWAAGVRGENIVVSSIDTGVLYTHNALVGAYRGSLGGGAFSHEYSWFDPYDASRAPVAEGSHGTHTMGIMLGDDGATPVGMAPGARWISCRGCRASTCGDVELLACAQFIAAPTRLDGTLPNADLRPHVVNNSWSGCGSSYDGWYQQVVDAWQAAGIYPLFANGNASGCGYSSPPGLNTVGNPARYGNVTGVGSTGTSSGLYAAHANWGPTDHPDQINPRGFPLLKPQVVAPGVGIYSAFAGSSSAYGLMTGTSMATPHVAGLVALMWSAAPNLVGDFGATETILEETATRIGYPSGGTPPPGWDNLPNYATGWGEINALRAVQLAQATGSGGRLAGTITRAADGSPLAGVRLVLQGGGYTLADESAAQGGFSRRLPAAEYRLIASKYGYLPQSAVLQVTAAHTTTLDLALSETPTHTLSGRVTDSQTGWPLYAQVVIGASADVYTQTVYTHPQTGVYQAVVAGTVNQYSLRVSSWTGGYTPATRLVGPLSAGQTEDFVLAADPLSCSAPGYALDGAGCAPATGGLAVGQVVDANTGSGLSGARIANAAGYATTSRPTPDDPANGDGLYVLFAPAGTAVFTASQVGGYAPLTQTVTLTTGQATRQDFWLAAGVLSAAPDMLLVESVQGQPAATGLTLRNTGGAPAGFSLQTLAVNEGFEDSSFPPAGWTVVDGASSRCGWQRSDAWGSPNYAGGQGFSAGADSDQCGSGTTMDTQLRSPVLDLRHAGQASLSFVASFHYSSGSTLRVDASPDGGASWTNHLFWSSSHSASGPGEAVTIDLAPYLGQSQVVVRFHYIAESWAWHAQVDQVRITIDDLDFSPASGTLAAGGDQLVAVRIDPLKFTQVGTYGRSVVVENTSPYPALYIPLTIVVQPQSYGVALAPPEVGAWGRPGQVVTHTLAITNTGTTTDTFALLPVGFGWGTGLPAAQVVLGAGERAVVQVRVALPWGAADGSLDEGRLEVHSQGDPGVTAAAVVRTRVWFFRLYLPWVEGALSADLETD